MFLKPIRLLLALAAIACAVLLSGCFKKGSPADPPAGGLTAVAGDGQVTLSWQPDSGVEYWLFWGPGTNVDVNHPISLKINVSSPFTVAPLLNGTTYAFTINGRKDGGPGGTPTPVVTATPRPTGNVWQIGGATGAADLKGVAFGTSFDAVGNAGALFQSADGVTWTPAAGNWAALAGGNNVNAIIYNARYIAVGDAGLILFSSDNTNWTAGTYAAPPLPAPKLNALATDGTRVVAVGDGGAIFYSDDSAVTWNAAATVPGGIGNLSGAARSSAGRWVAVGAAGTVITSTDGSNWGAVTSVSPAIATDLTGVAVLPLGTFAAVGAGGEVASSSDGLVWTTEAITTSDLLAVAPSVTGTSLFAAVGKTGVAFTSFDGITWVNRATGTLSDLLAVVSGAGQFVAVGQAGTTIYSK
jgi:photosystem II stability/assembly factor-like uncharacterized protein